MANKSVIDIEIQDAAFKEFVALFEKYQSQLGKMPGQWGKVGEQTKKGVAGFGGAVESLGKANTSLKSFLDTQQKSIANQRKFNQFAGETARTFNSIGKSAISIGKSVTATTASLLKWVGIGSVLGLLGGAGGLFGYKSLAAGESNERRKTLGLGITRGELKSAQLNFERYFGEGGVDPMLQRLNEYKSDITKHGLSFQAIGINPREAGETNTSDLFVKSMTKAVERFNDLKATTAPEQLKSRAEALHVTDIYDFETLKQLSALQKGELAQAIQNYYQGKKTYDLTDSQLKSWQTLNTLIDQAGASIKTTFLDRVTQLNAPLGQLSKSFTDAVNTFLRSDVFGEWINKATTGLEHFGKYLTSDEFTKDVEGFISGVGKVSDAIGKVADGLEWLGDKFAALMGKDPKIAADAADLGKPYAGNPLVGQADLEGAAWLKHVGTWAKSKATNLYDAAKVRETERKNGLPAGSLDRIWYAESGRGQNNGPSSAGALGPWQYLTPEIAKEDGVDDRTDPDQSREGAGRRLARLRKYYGGDIVKATAAYNRGQGNLDKSIGLYGNDWKKDPKTLDYLARTGYMDAEGKQSANTPAGSPMSALPSSAPMRNSYYWMYTPLFARISNETGNNITTIGNQLAPQPGPYQ